MSKKLFHKISLFTMLKYIIYVNIFLCKIYNLVQKNHLVMIILFIFHY